MVLSTINSSTTFYTYDGDGRRVMKTWNFGTAAAQTTSYVYDALGQMVAEYGVATAPDSGTKFITADHLGSTRLVTDMSQSQKACYDYLPFGEQIPSGTDGRTSTCFTGTTVPLTSKFTGKEREGSEAASMDYFGARYMSSQQGRFTSPDWSAKPQAVPYEDLYDPQSLNLYAYVENNPLSHADPDGHGLDCTSGHNAEGVGCQFLAKWNADHGIDDGTPATGATAEGRSVTYTYADGSTIVLKGNHNFRDNNPGNNIAGAGKIGRDGAFVIFASPSEGWDALVDNIGKHTNWDTDILDLIKTRTPADDGKNPLLKGNDPEGYAKRVAAQVGVETSTKLSSLDLDQLNTLVVAIGREEGYFAATNSAKYTPPPNPR
jgi:RHS repeat-associated protein